jgi:hypothetical protein
MMQLQIGAEHFRNVIVKYRKNPKLFRIFLIPSPPPRSI